jgi:hypothetical protein
VHSTPTPKKELPVILSIRAFRPAKSYENRSELIYAAARSGEVDDAMDKPRPIYCLIRSMRVERMIERRDVFPSGEQR